MTRIAARKLHFKDLNAQIRASEDPDIIIDDCIGQRYIGSGLSGKNLVINGVPGNALGAYLDGATIRTSGNAQDATADTMGDGLIVINGSCGDGAGYGMRGGKIFIRDNVGYRAGIHMKAYKEKRPVMVIGGIAGSFLGEYQAGGLIIVLGLNKPEDRPLLGYFGATGMHGGKIFLRTDVVPNNLAPKVVVNDATPEDMAEIEQYIDEYCGYFGADKEAIMNSHFFVLTPDSKNPYKQLYTYN
jgi:glutamate synthase domain-containing protein 3